MGVAPYRSRQPLSRQVRAHTVVDSTTKGVLLYRRTALALFTIPVLLLAAISPASAAKTPQPLSPQDALEYYKVAYTNTSGLLNSVPFTSTEKVYGPTGRLQGHRILTVDSAGNSSYDDDTFGTTIHRGAYQYISIDSSLLGDNWQVVQALAKLKRAKYLRAPIAVTAQPPKGPLSTYAVDALLTDITSMTAGEVSLVTTGTTSILSWPERGDSKVGDGTYQVTIKNGLITDSRLVSSKKKTIDLFTYKINPPLVRAPSGPYVEWSAVTASPRYKPAG